MKVLTNFVIAFVAGFTSVEAQIVSKVEIQQLEVGEYAQGPVLSPDGTTLAFSRQHYSGVSIMNLKTNEIKRVCDHPGAGWGMTWLDNGKLVVRAMREGLTPRERAMAVEVIDVVSGATTEVVPFDRFNRIEVPQKLAPGRVSIRNRQMQQMIDVTNNEVRTRRAQKSEELRSHDGRRIGLTRTVQAPDGRDILSVKWSPDGSRAIVYVMGLPSLYLFDEASLNFQLLAERGENPVWINDDLYVYGETTDDGHVITGGELYVASLSRSIRQNLTEHFGPVAMHPSASSEGSVAFHSLDGNLFLIRLALSE